jgi:DNA-binding winged helix-turn-helix (wHTH) protein
MREDERVPRAVRFGPFELDLVTGELLRAGLGQRLQVQPFHVLALLVQRAGELVTRDELRAALWPDDVFVDVEHGLNVVIAKLRRTLGDNVDEPHYIETLERRGYRFLAPIEPVATHARPPTSPHRFVGVTVGDATITLGEGTHLVGRDPLSAVWINDKAVSRRHASITVTPHGVAINDLGSRNGTFVNGRRVSDVAMLADGDETRLGAIRLVVHMNGSAESTTVDEELAVAQ